MGLRGAAVEDSDSLLKLLRDAQGVKDFLRHQVLDNAKLAGWRCFYGSPGSSQCSRGVNGANLFTVEAESDVSDNMATDGRLRADPDTKRAPVAVYESEIPDVLCRRLQFHQVGTTPFLLRVGEPRSWGIEKHA